MMESVARYLDHAVLKPELTQEEVREAIQLGIDHEVRTVCVRPCDIAMAVEMCRSTQTDVSCVLGFPHGCGLSAVKAEEARQYCDLGAKELDMVANYGWIRSGSWQAVHDDIQGVVEVAHQKGSTVKVIFETSQLSPDQIARTTEIAIDAGADYVKTSTGFYGNGASEEGIRIMLETACGRIKVKPSGGIRDYARARMFLDMGCGRLGVNYTSTPVICAGESEAAK